MAKPYKKNTPQKTAVPKTVAPKTTESVVSTPQKTESKPLPHALLLGGVCLLTFIVFWPALSNGFTNWDDPGYVTTNPHLALTWENMGRWFTKPVLGNIHPLTMLSLGIDHAFGGIDSAFPYHLTSLLFHLLNTALVYALALRLGNGNRTIALITSLFFAIHPLHVQPVAWVASRKDVLYTAFFLGGLLAYDRYLTTRHWALYAGTLLLFIASAMSKPAAAVFPVVLLLLDFYRRRPADARLWLEKLPFFALALYLGWLTIGAQGEAIRHTYSLPQRLIFGAYGFMAYLCKAFYWGNLAAFYPYPPRGQALPGYFLASVAGVVAVLGLALWSLRYHRVWFFALAFFAVNVALVLQVVTVGSSLLADRYTYLAYFGLFFGVGWGFTRLPAGSVWRYGASAALALLAIAAAWQARRETGAWKDTIALFSQNIKHYPKANLPYINRAEAYWRKKDFENGLRDLNKANAVEPYHPLTLRWRGLIQYDLNRIEAAKKDFDWLITNKEADAKSYVWHGGCLVKTGKFAEALTSYNQALAMDSTSGEAYSDRATAYFSLKNYQAAVQDYTKAISLLPKPAATIKNRAAAHIMLANHAAALTDAEEALKTFPDDGQLHYFSGLALRGLGRTAEAETALARAKALGFSVSG